MLPGPTSLHQSEGVSVPGSGEVLAFDALDHITNVIGTSSPAPLLQQIPQISLAVAFAHAFCPQSEQVNLDLLSAFARPNFPCVADCQFKWKPLALSFA